MRGSAAEVIYHDLIAESPVGSILIAAGRNGLCAVIIGERTGERALETLVGLFPGEEIKSSRHQLAPYRAQIRAYFSKESMRFSFPLDLSAVRSFFYRKVLAKCRMIPFGHIRSYGQLASSIGAPGAARAVGNALGANPLPIVIPCHRVIASTGDLGGYSGGLEVKRKLLAHESVPLRRRQLERIIQDSSRRRRTYRSELAF
jgi:methylated-DNA-[protein]-cysteine S-methyltransferase